MCVRSACWSARMGRFFARTGCSRTVKRPIVETMLRLTGCWIFVAMVGVAVACGGSKSTDLLEGTGGGQGGGKGGGAGGGTGGGGAGGGGGGGGTADAGVQTI